MVAGGQAPASLDWAEVLRTGSIPLPARSRGTYSAPGRASSAPRNRGADTAAIEPEVVDSGPIDLLVEPPSGPIRFEIRHIGRQRYAATNLGAATAEAASIEGAGEDRHLIRPLDPRARAVGPGEGLAFSVLRVEGRHVSVQVAWQQDGENRSVELPIA